MVWWAFGVVGQHGHLRPRGDLLQLDVVGKQLDEQHGLVEGEDGGACAAAPDADEGVAWVAETAPGRASGVSPRCVASLPGGRPFDSSSPRAARPRYGVSIGPTPASVVHLQLAVRAYREWLDAVGGEDWVGGTLTRSTVYRRPTAVAA